MQLNAENLRIAQECTGIANARLFELAVLLSKIKGLDDDDLLSIQRKISLARSEVANIEHWILVKRGIRKK